MRAKVDRFERLMDAEDALQDAATLYASADSASRDRKAWRRLRLAAIAYALRLAAIAEERAA